MLDRFVRLCEIASPTGSEREVADAVVAELRELGFRVERVTARMLNSEPYAVVARIARWLATSG
jgi:putative aminopeptidase FrvX